MKKEFVKRIALYGGAFDPPHKGHTSIIENLSSLPFITEIWLLPSGDRNDKKLLLNKDERFELLTKLIAKTNHTREVKLCDQEIQLSKKENRMIPTIQLLEYFEKKYGEFQFYFVVGADIFCTINTWKGYEKLLREQNFIIYPRIGYMLKKGKVGAHLDFQTEGTCKICANVPESYYLSSHLAPEISSSFIKNTLLDETLGKKEKRSKVEEFLDEITIKTLETKNLI